MPIIPITTWEIVQAKLEQPVKRRAPKTADLWLAGLVYCGNCGVKMRGQKRKRYSQFLCQTGDRKRMGKKGITCLRNTLHHELVEEVIDRWLRETGQAIATLAEAQRTGDLGLLKTLESDFQTCKDTHFKLVERQDKFVLHFEKAKIENPDPIIANVEAHQARSNLTETYKREYTAHADQLRQRQTALETEHSRQMGIIERFEDNPRALKKKQEELSRLEAELEDAEAQLEDVSAKILAQLLRWSERR